MRYVTKFCVYLLPCYITLLRSCPACRQYQQRLPSELLSSLATVLVKQAQVFELVRVLAEVQRQAEKELFNERLKVKATMDEERRRFKERYSHEVNRVSGQLEELPRLTLALDAEREKMDERHAEAMRKFDLEAIQALDQKAIDQQRTMENSGVPGFRVTTNPTETRVQMYLLEFISRLDGQRW